MSGPIIHIGIGRTASECPELSTNPDVKVKAVTDPNNPVINEKKKYFVSCTVRNSGNASAQGVTAQLWWSPANITGATESQCFGAFFPGAPQVLAQMGPFPLNVNESKTTDLVWDVPDMPQTANVSGGYKLILKAYYPGVNGMNAQGPNSALPREKDPRCGVRAITIVGV